MSFPDTVIVKQGHHYWCGACLTVNSSGVALATYTGEFVTSVMGDLQQRSF